MCPIEFHLTESQLDLVPHPYPASRHVPEWFKGMAADFTSGSEQGGTLKRCPPYLAAMTAGYVIPAPADVRLLMTPQGQFEARGKVPFLSTHFPEQVAGAPFAGSEVVKFHNPWIIVTPPEYVCLITAPINRFELPFVPLTGIVETGVYYQEVHVPMICAMRPGQTYELRQGAPMIQVIPMRRDDWQGKVGPIDQAKRAEQQAMFQANRHFYKDHFWQKVTFS
jgi:hypothetical protein